MPYRPDPPRIAYVLKRFPRFSETFILNELLAHEAAGAEVHVFSLREPHDEPRHAGLARLRARVTMLSGIKGRGAAQDAADTALFPGKTPSQIARLIAQARAVAEHASTCGIRHLHAHFGSDATTVALLAARRSGGTFSYTAHARDIYHTYVSQQQDDAMRRAKLRAAAFTVTVSDYNLRYLRSLCPEAAPRILRLYNGIDLSTFSPVAPDRQRPGQLLAVGRLVEKKGFGMLLDACALLRESGVDFRLDLVGEGPLEDVLRRQITELGLNRCVTMTGNLRQEALVLRMARAQAAVLPCIVTDSGDRDGLPTVLLEAMARSLPVVTTTVTGGPEIVKNGVTGLLCRPADPQSLADAIGDVLTDPVSAARMGRAGRARAERLFDLRQNAARLRRLLANPDTALQTEAA